MYLDAFCWPGDAIWSSDLTTSDVKASTSLISCDALLPPEAAAALFVDARICAESESSEDFAHIGDTHRATINVVSRLRCMFGGFDKNEKGD